MKEWQLGMEERQGKGKEEINMVRAFIESPSSIVYKIIYCGILVNEV
jgi:hypothetical protein